VNATLPATVSETPGAGIIKSGAATLTMSGASTYDGPTNINAGTLLVTNTTGSGTGTGAVIVNNSGTLGGTGAIAGATTINGGGRITGGTVGTTGALTLQSSVTFTGASGSSLATYLVDLSGSASDRLNITGALNLNGAFDQISFSGTPDGTTTYVLATYGSVSGTFDFGSAPAGYTLSYGSGELDLVPIPEPSTWVAAALSVFLFGCTQRKRLLRLQTLKSEKLKR
jgi:fibronectin-binding autotransporter adhesin